MIRLIDKAISRFKSEKPDFKIYTTSIWTDPNACVSSINFDSKENSLNNIKKLNDWSKDYYAQFLAEGDLEQAELFKPKVEIRSCNPANFELRDFEEMTHRSFPENWESETNGNCWRELEPALVEIGNYAVSKIKNLNIDDNFELSINSNKDWYDKTWQ
ncbi:MAG: hypothetical protein IPK31_01190 [Chitinophagaceae bacterium]|nr:hypothetical protein [Chitinophagaceae bacterium]